MKPHMNLSILTMTLMLVMISGIGCAQTCIPRRYYGTTTYTTLPRVYTTRPVVTHGVSPYYGTTTYMTPARVYTTQPVITYGVPTYRYQTTTYAPVTRQVCDVEKRAAEITRQVNRQAAEIEARVRRQAEEIEANVRRQTEEIERRIAQQTATARQVSQSTRRPIQTTTRLVHSQPYTQSLSYGETGLVCETSCSSSTVPDASASEDGNLGESQWNAIVAKGREWGSSVTTVLETAPWWIWTIGAVLVFIVVFAVCVKDANNRPFQANGDDPWVVDPSGH